MTLYSATFLVGNYFSDIISAAIYISENKNTGDIE